MDIWVAPIIDDFNAVRLLVMGDRKKREQKFSEQKIRREKSV